MENIYLAQPATQSRKLKPLIVLLVTGSLLGALLYWLYGHSFLSITVSGPVDSKIQYSLTNQKSKESSDFISKSTTVKKLVKKGTYEVLIKNQENSSFSITSTRAFLGKTELSVKLQPEKKRSFVGNNPGPCMYYGQSLLYTYGCSENYESLTAHLPASNDMPTTTINPEDVHEDLFLGGIINIDNKDMLLVSHLGGGEEKDDKPHRLYELNPDLQLINYLPLVGLSASESYKITAYGEGLLLHDSDIKDVFVFDSISATPKKIDIKEPDKNKLVGKELSVDGSRIAVAYVNPDRLLETHGEGEPIEDEETVVQVQDSGRTKSFHFDKSYYLARLCAKKYICLVQDRELAIYDISGDKAILVASVGNVYNFKAVDGKLMVVRYDGVLELDIEKRSGFMQYSFGAYSPCGIEADQNKGYVLCLINPENDKVALYVDAVTNNVDSIDKKILSMLDQPYIDTVSIHRSFIYVVPNLGELVYNSAINGYSYDHAIKQKAAADIDSLVDRLSIDRTRYNIINTQP